MTPRDFLPFPQIPHKALRQGLGHGQSPQDDSHVCRGVVQGQGLFQSRIKGGVVMKRLLETLSCQLMTPMTVCLTMLLSMGCGGGDMPELGDVSGKVTLDGKPLVGINILFTPEKGRPAGGVTDEEGYYELVYLDGYSGCKVGPAKVTFEWSPGVENTVAVPARYMNDGFSVTVKAGSNEMDFPLESK